MPNQELSPMPFVKMVENINFSKRRYQFLVERIDSEILSCENKRLRLEIEELKSQTS